MLNQKLLLTMALLLALPSTVLFAQATNTFPATGDVGIGTTSPLGVLDVAPSQSGASNWEYYRGNVAGMNPSTGFGWGLAMGANLSNANGEANLVFGTGAGNNAGLAIGEWNGAHYTADMFIRSGGNVGIGTTAPQLPLYIVNGVNELGVAASGSLISNGGNGSLISNRFTQNGNNHAETSRIELGLMDGANGYNAGSIAFLTAPDIGGSPAVLTRMLIDKLGNVGIGTTTPQSKLEVNGGLRFTNDPAGNVQTTAWTGILCGGDYAESVDVTGPKKSYEPGDVMVVDPEKPGAFLKATEPYSTLVAGIYSTKPGVVGKRTINQDIASEVPMAMVGIVPTKVTTENGPIKPGDLLVTSSSAGYAMRGTDRERLAGAVLGKALGSVSNGTGLIEVLVTLQ